MAHATSHVPYSVQCMCLFRALPLGVAAQKVAELEQRAI